MRICYFGIYDPGYSSNRIFIRGLRENGVEVTECRSAKHGTAKYFDLIRQHRALHGAYDAMVVGYPGQQATILARCITRKPIVFNALVSFYDSLVFDRKTVGRRSIGALYYWLLDWLSCRAADAVILDTNAHIDYFVKTFGVPREKFHRIFIGSDPSAFRPSASSHNEKFTVHFHGFFNPLQGVSYVVRAAKLLEGDDILFNIIGTGPQHIRPRVLADELGARNIHFSEPVSFEELNERIARADVCLGIFGDTDKARRVIPNKVFEALAARKPVITSRTPAVEELLVDREQALFCNGSDAEDLADKIRELKRDAPLRERIAEAGYRLFSERLQPKELGRELKGVIVSVISAQ
jgi:glycosyltransferase involved in cell wall biosynthesis